MRFLASLRNDGRLRQKEEGVRNPEGGVSKMCYFHFPLLK